MRRLWLAAVLASLACTQTNFRRLREFEADPTTVLLGHDRIEDLEPVLRAHQGQLMAGTEAELRARGIQNLRARLLGSLANRFGRKFPAPQRLLRPFGWITAARVIENPRLPGFLAVFHDLVRHLGGSQFEMLDHAKSPRPGCDLGPEQAGPESKRWKRTIFANPIEW
jgi:hypothetical protein